MARIRLGFLLGAVFTVLLALAAPLAPAGPGGSGYTLVGWNDLGMHCMDADFAIFSILPPFNTIHAQLIDPQGQLVTTPGAIVVTYEAVADPQGSFNSTSRDKTNFWQYAKTLYGADVAVDDGLAGYSMPGPPNTPRVMEFDAVQAWFSAVGIPITPTDDHGTHNAYPMMRLVARDGAGNLLATTDIVLPVSDEMDCRACHGSGSGPDARPRAGGANDPDPQIDYRLNILQLHDERRDNRTLYEQTLSQAGYDPRGLYATAHDDGRPILCAACHPSNALPGSGQSGMPQLTQSVHSVHDNVTDPLNGMTLGQSANRSACYRCHPGSTTRCLRGAMGAAVASDGSMEMQCQSCHGSMSNVGTVGRTGWLDQPSCQNCHTGDARSNAGQIRYTTAFLPSGARRQPASPLFATNADVPLPGFDLYRFSYGHGGVACEGCHGSTHAEYPTGHANDNVQSTQLQGHVGVISDCRLCHNTSPRTVTGGPHGMHPVGQDWVGRHGDAAEDGGSGRCAACHGSDSKGTVLSRALGDRSLSTEFGARTFWRGFQVSCYACHNGPNSESATKNTAPAVQDLSVVVAPGTPRTVTLPGTDKDANQTLSFRVVTQPQHATVGVTGNTATIYPDAGFEGSDRFTFAAWDGLTNSNLGTATLSVSGQGCQLTCAANVPATASEGTAISFVGSATATGCAAAPQYAWAFGDGQAGSGTTVQHAYALSGTYAWTMTASADGTSCSTSGSVVVGGAPPTITRIKPVKNGSFNLVVSGSNFHSQVDVLISGAPWSDVTWKSAGTLVLGGGKALKARFPKKAWVPITVVNLDDGLSTTVEFNRKTKSIR